MPFCISVFPFPPRPSASEMYGSSSIKKSMVAALKLHLQRSKWVLPLLKSEIRNQIDKTNNLLLTTYLYLVTPMEVSSRCSGLQNIPLWIAVTPPSCLITGITGDGRCLFRSVAYGACLRRGKHPPSDSAQKELADELRAKVSVHHLDFCLLSASLPNAFLKNSEMVRAVLFLHLLHLCDC